MENETAKNGITSSYPRGIRDGGTVNDLGMWNHVETEGPTIDADLWVASLEETVLT